MPSERQFEANRANAQKSTGPKTPEGKAAVRLNGLKHGLAAETILVPGEDPAKFQALLDDYIAEYQPATPTDEFLVRQLVMADWRMARLHRIEGSYYNLNQKMQLNPGSLNYSELTDAERLASDFSFSSSKLGTLFNLHRYEQRLERSAKIAREELNRRRLALVNPAPVAAPVKRPKAQPSPKIINIETAQHPPAQASPAPEPPPSPLLAADAEIPNAK